MLPAEHRDARRLQVLKGAREVEERLRARAYRDDGMAGERVEVRGDVAGQLGPPVHAADAARGEDLDARGVGQGHRGGHGRYADLEALRRGNRDVPLGYLPAAREDPFLLPWLKADARLPVEDGRDSGLGTAGAERGRDSTGDRDRVPAACGAPGRPRAGRCTGHDLGTPQRSRPWRWPCPGSNSTRPRPRLTYGARR